MNIFAPKQSFMHILSAFLFILCNIYAQSPVAPDAKLEEIASGFQFVEGPVWHEEVGLLFSDIPANTVYKWTPESGTETYLTPSGNSNGLAYDIEGRLLLAQHGNRRIARIESNGDEINLVSHYEGNRLNSPNDMALKSDGSIFFTDPPYGLSAGEEEIGFYGVYRLNPSGSLRLLDSSLTRPNGIAFSPDESKLYVSDTEIRIIFVWDVVDDSILSNKQQFASMNAAGYADGMKVDAEGNLFATGPFGVWVFAPDGTVLDTIHVPGQTTNCNWGDSDRKTLYITSGSSVYRIRVESAGTPVPDQGFHPVQSFELYNNYPNPFNTTTTIHYTIPNKKSVLLNIYDSTGREIETLVNATQTPGSYCVTYEANSLASGVYFYRLQAGNFRQTKKLILMK
jgi:sugar lactone lactonase YvrE